MLSRREERCVTCSSKLLMRKMADVCGNCLLLAEHHYQFCLRTSRCQPGPPSLNCSAGVDLNVSTRPLELKEEELPTLGRSPFPVPLHATPWALLRNGRGP